MLGKSWFLTSFLAIAALGCTDNKPVSPGDSSEEPWSFAVRAEAAALIGVHGTAKDDVWVCGADDGTGPVVLHFDGAAWERQATGVRGDLWWAHALENGDVYFGGSDALLLRYRDAAFE